MSNIFGKEEPPAEKIVAYCNEWIDLKIYCPGCESASEPSFWKHRDCGGRTQINSEALLRCSRCCDPYSILSGRWSCSDHEGTYKKADKTRLVTALMVGVSIFSKQGPTVWTNKLLESIALLKIS